MYELLRNPAYAGAFAYGRRGPSPDGRLGPRGRAARRLHTAPEAWAVLHQDVYPAYITWEQYMANQQRLTDNAARAALRARGAPRAGAALLAGLAVCGRCGHQMRVAYKARHRYVCNAQAEEYGDRMCLSLDGPSLDAAVVAAFFAALAPAELALLDEVLAAQRAERERLAGQYADQVARAEYEARLAQRRYQAIDPDNRLVAAELERRWELALRAAAEAREAAERFARAPAAPAARPGPPGAAARPRPPPPRPVAERPPHPRPPEGAPAQPRPAGGRHPPRAGRRRGPGRVGERGRHRPDGAPAGPPRRRPARSTAGWSRGRWPWPPRATRTPRSPAASRPRASARRGTPTSRRRWSSGSAATHGLVSLTERFRREDRFEGAWTVGGLARALDVTADWVRQRIADGTVPAQRHAATGRYLIPDDPAALAGLRARAAARHP